MTYIVDMHDSVTWKLNFDTKLKNNLPPSSKNCFTVLFECLLHLRPHPAPPCMWLEMRSVAPVTTQWCHIVWSTSWVHISIIAASWEPQALEVGKNKRFSVCVKLLFYCNGKLSVKKKLRNLWMSDINFGLSLWKLFRKGHSSLSYFWEFHG